MIKPYMRTIIRSARRDFVLIILLQLYGFKAEFFEGTLFWVGQYDSTTFILEEKLIRY